MTNLDGAKVEIEFVVGRQDNGYKILYMLLSSKSNCFTTFTDINDLPSFAKFGVPNDVYLNWPESHWEGIYFNISENIQIVAIKIGKKWKGMKLSCNGLVEKLKSAKEVTKLISGITKLSSNVNVGIFHSGWYNPSIGIFYKSGNWSCSTLFSQLRSKDCPNTEIVRFLYDRAAKDFKVTDDEVYAYELAKGGIT